MSKPRYGWWSYAKYMVREYPKLKLEYEERQSQRMTSIITNRSGTSMAHRPTENTVLRQLSPAKQAEYDAVAKAVDQTAQLPTGPERLRLIDMVFWKQSHTLDGAACALGYSYETAQRFHRDFLRLVGFNRGLAD